MVASTGLQCALHMHICMTTGSAGSCLHLVLWKSGCQTSLSLAVTLAAATNPALLGSADQCTAICHTGDSL
jgi:hypothetical protein